MQSRPIQLCELCLLDRTVPCSAHKTKNYHKPQAEVHESVFLCIIGLEVAEGSALVLVARQLPFAIFLEPSAQAQRLSVGI